jgi:hypothetical protein
MNPTWLYVGALYALAVGLARRGGVPLRRRIAMLFYAMVVVFLFKPMTGPYVSLATDVLQLLPPWSASAPPELDKFTVSNYEQQDVIMQLVPWAHFVRESWKSGRIPLWNELTGCGFPFIANGQGQAMSPLRLLALPLPLGYAMTAEGAMKILIGLTFTFLYCRRRGYGETPSAIAACIFGFGPFLGVWLHFAQGTVACFLPMVIYAIDLIAERVTYARFVFAALCGPLVLYTGHPETTAHIFAFAVLYVAWLAVTENRKFIPALIGAGAVSVLLSLPFLVPFFEGMRKSWRYQMVQLHPHRGIPFSDFPSMVTTFQPRFYGTRPQAVAWGPAQAESITAFAGMLATAAWFGLLAWVIAKRQWRSRECFFVIASLFLYLVLEDWEPVSGIVKTVLAIAPNARLRLPLAWCGAILTAALLERERKFACIGLAGAVSVLGILVGKTHFPDDAAFRGAMIAMIPSLVVLGIAALPRFRVALLLLFVAINVEIWLVTQHWNPARPLATLYPRTPLIDAVLRHRGEDRVVGIGPPLFPNLNFIYGIEDVRVLDAMAPHRYLRVIDLNLNEYYPKWNDAESPLLDFLNARWAMTAAGVALDANRYRLVYDGADGRLYENRTALPRFFAARNVVLESDGAKFEERLRAHRDWSATVLTKALHVSGARVQHDLLAPRTSDDVAAVRIEKHDATDYTLHVEAPRHTLIASSIGWWEGWRIEANGKRLAPELVNGAFLGFVVPPGAATVRVRYVPVTWYASVAVSLLTALAVGIIRRRV